MRNVVKVAQCKRDCRVGSRLRHLQQQSSFKNTEHGFGCCCLEQLIAQCVSSHWIPQVIEPDVLIAQLIRGQLQKRKDSARLEVDADHRGLLIGVNHEKLRMRTTYNRAVK